MLINRLINDPYITKKGLINLLKKVDSHFFNTYKQKATAHFDFLKHRKSIKLSRKNASTIFSHLLHNQFFILEKDQIIENKIKRDPNLFSFVDENIDIFLCVALKKLTTKSDSSGEIEPFYPHNESELSDSINNLWQAYLSRYPDSDLFYSFQKDPRIELLISQEKLNFLVNIYSSLD